MELDRIDRKIVAALMADATIPLSRLSDMVGLSSTPCWKRVRRLMQNGVIRGKVALVDPEQLGLGMTVFVSLTAPDQSPDWHEDFARVIAAIPEIMEAHQVAGDQDYALRIVVRDMADYERIRQDLVSRVAVRGLTARFLTRRLKFNTVLPVDTSAA